MPKTAIFLNHKHPESANLGLQVADHWQKEGGELFLFGEDRVFDPADCSYADFSGVDLALVLGGDGTVLAAVNHLAPFGVKILGINLGNLGFLCEIEKEDLFPALDRVLAGDFWLEERIMLHGSLRRQGEQLLTYSALNDFIVSSSSKARAITLEAFCNEEFIGSYRGDGLLVATPTGSTAYSLSSGGPILFPDTKALIINPVCCHSFFSRPLVVPAAGEIKIICRGEEALLTADGQQNCYLKQDDLIIIKKSPHQARLIRLGESRFFATLSRKMGQP
ncbi:MAG: NAD(+)/NADH kinase [Clostridiales bacterium]|nr:NAD(+)/NADH kinase [Clostridiales bacterium]